MSNGVGLAPLKTREYVDLLKAWGFTETEQGGNHPMFLTPFGRRFPMSSPGKVTMAELRQAAKIVGVSKRQFLIGPPKKVRPMRTVMVPVSPKDELREEQDRLVAEMNLVVDRAEQRAKEKEMAKVVEKRRSYVKIQDKVRQYVEDHPGRGLRVMEIEKAVGANPRSGSVHLALKTLSERDEKLRKLEPGVWFYDGALNGKAKPMGGEQLAAETKRRNGNLTASLLEWIEQNPDRPVSIQMVAEATGNAPGSTGHALLSMSEKGIIERLARGIYRYNTPQATPGSAQDAPGAPQTGGVVSTHPDDQPIELVPTTLSPLAQAIQVREARSSGRLDGKTQSIGRPRQPGDLGAGTTWPGNVALMWEQLNDLGDGCYLLRSDDGAIWVARMQKVDV